MYFIYKKWDSFCKKISEENIKSITCAGIFNEKENKYLTLKHDVETNVKKAYKIAKIENKYGHIVKIPFMKKFVSKYYYLAKKI